MVIDVPLIEDVELPPPLPPEEPYAPPLTEPKPAPGSGPPCSCGGPWFGTLTILAYWVLDNTKSYNSLAKLSVDAWYIPVFVAFIAVGPVSVTIGELPLLCPGLFVKKYLTAKVWFGIASRRFIFSIACP